jgi:hydrogenase-4 transcriptional activator
METFLPLLLEIWRQAGRQLHLEASLAAMLPLLSRRLPLTWVRVLRLEPERMGLELAAGAAGEPHLPCAPEDWGALLDWCAQGRCYRGSAAGLPAPLAQAPWLSASTALLAGGLRDDNGPLGILLFGASPDEPFLPAHEPLFGALLEPLAVALGNHQRLRRLNAQREAAEADRRSMLARLGRQDIADTLIGADRGLREVMERVALVARADTPVLILGETGTGKEVVARAIHQGSPRANGPFLRVNCGALPPELIDSELFGHERGSFTGAVAQRQGWFERADRGTLFLDEIGELSPSAQVRLLRILQDGSLQRVGGQQQLRVDVRLLAATHRDLFAMVGAGSFREDLWYRIAVFPIRLPALRERPGDIPALAAHFAARAAQRLGLPDQIPDPADLALLLAYPWPGNVRELASVMERAAILGDGRRLEIAQSLGSPAPSPAPSPGPVAGAPDSRPATLDEVTRQHILRVLAQTLGRIEGPFGAARLLDVNPHTLRARMRRLGIDWTRYRPAG